MLENEKNTQIKPSFLSVLKDIVFIAVISFCALILIVYILGSFFSDDKKKHLEKEAFQVYQEKMYNSDKEIKTKDFEKAFKDAKNNRIKYDRLSKTYISGNYKKNYVVNSHYLKTQSEIENETLNYKVNFECLQDVESEFKIDGDKGTKRKLLSCGLYPTEINSNRIKDLDDKFYITLMNYSLSRSESLDVYYINGVFYTKELANDIINDFNK